MASIQNPHLDGDPFYLPGGPQGILLIHGLTATAAEVRPLAQWLHQRGYTVAGPLLPGHYTQPDDLNHVRWQDWAACVEAMYLRLKEECSQVIVGGESTGAMLALYTAIYHPDVAALLLYAPALKLSFTLIDSILIYLLAPFVSTIPKKNIDGDMPWQGYFVNPLKGVLQLIRLQAFIRARLDKITQPALIVQGRLDATLDPHGPDILRRSLGSQIVESHWMENSTHCVILDRESQKVYGITSGFLDRVFNL